MCWITSYCNYIDQSPQLDVDNLSFSSRGSPACNTYILNFDSHLNMTDHGSPPGLMKDTEGGANAIKTFYLNFFNEQTKFSFTSMSFLFVMLWMIILMATTRYMRTLLTNYLKHAITEQSKEAKRLSPIKEVKKVGSLKRSET